MAIVTYIPIATQTLGSSATSITFSSIPSTYTDLRLILTGTSIVADAPIVQFNGDTLTNYAYTGLNGNGTGPVSQNSTNTNYYRINPGTNGNMGTTVSAFYTLDIFSYAGSTNKTILGSALEDTNGAGGVTVSVGLWRSTAAITSIALKLASANSYATGTIATLWGI